MLRPITVLVALWKAGKYLDAKLRDLERQTIFKDCNIVLLNCQNLDDERSIYKNFMAHNNVYAIEYSNHIRLYNSWNDGIKLTKSTYITNSNVDDMQHPEYLERCVNWLESNPDYSIVSSEVLVADIPNQAWPNWKHCSDLPKLTYPQSSAGPCPVWRRSLHDKYGMFDDYRVIGDAKMWEKWHAGGERFGLIHEPLTLYYISNDSLERRFDHTANKLYRDLDCEE